MITNINLKDKKVLLRVDYNVPVKDGIIIDDYRIKKSIPTINHCLKEGASITIMSHLGRPIKNEQNYSLFPIAEKLEELLNKDVIFSEDCISDKSFMNSSKLKKGEIHLLENLRFHDGETLNCPDFSRLLSFHGDVFINDAFGTAHRSHASNVGVASFFDEKSMGFLMQKELEYLSDKIQNPENPFIVIMGGAKINGKIELIENFLNISDYLIIGGALSFPFLKIKGIEIESPLIDKESLENAKKLLDYADMKNKNIIFPSDFVTASSIEAVDTIDIKLLKDIGPNVNCYDIGPETTMLFSQLISEAKTILWNGPLGVSENPYFGTGTQQICRIIEELTSKGVTSVLGGGDTASAARRFSHDNGFTHISTGGGASLELLSGRELPAIKALNS
tara:strand:+ start:1 stop:1176 length:1176 start_codon:yes stop_codon:yes gene_type:complete